MYYRKQSKQIQGLAAIVIMFMISMCMLLHGTNIVAAANRQYKNFQYEIINNEAIITSYTGSASKVTIPSKIGKRKVTKINEYVFYGNNSIKEVKIPSGITYIGSYAFTDCKNLKKVTLPSTLTHIDEFAFYRCTSLTKIKLPNSITKIGAAAFRDCKKLKDVTLPNNLKEIPDSLFLGCSLESISLPSKLSKIGCYAFSETHITEVKIPSSVKQIDSCAFSKCTSLESIQLPDSLKEIAYKCFADCKVLKEITLPKKLKKISISAFSGCSSLAMIDLPNSLEEIDDYAFYHCSSLTEINILTLTKLMGIHIFNGCEKLERITLPDADNIYEEEEYIQNDYVSAPVAKGNILPQFLGCTSLCEINNLSDTYFEVIDQIVYSKGQKELIRYFPVKEDTEFTIPKTVTSIKDYAFAGASNLQNVSMPDSVESIGIGLFYKSGVLNIDLSKKLDCIPYYTYYGCPLKEVVIPKHITSIRGEAFAQCTNLETFTLHDGINDIDFGGEGCSQFKGCKSLKEFKLTGKESKSKCKVIDGVLFWKYENKATELVSYPAQKADATYTVPDETKYISTFAFDSNQNLRKLYLNKKLHGIYQIFIDCHDLKIYVPAEVTEFMGEEHIGEWPIFNNCTNCYLYVKKGSEAYKFCANNKIPYKIWK